MTEVRKHKPKNDRYAKTRGASQFYDIYCVACGTYLVLYQKDGPGALIRMYLDRIFEPTEIASLNEGNPTKESLPTIRCSKCEQVIATPMVYEPENRLAFRMRPGSFSKKKSDGTFPPLSLRTPGERKV